jgi:short subunit dehydrogenase-like uncharacterized protein
VGAGEGFLEARPRHDRIVLFGATGFTGQLIARRLDQLAIPFTMAVRDAAAARALRSQLRTAPAVEIVDVLERGQVRRAVAGARIVVSCVGPYNLFGHGLLEECRGQDLVYIDLTGEQEFVRRSREDVLSHPTRCTFLHSIAFESTLADLLASSIIRPGAAVSDVSSFYRFANSRPSPGTYLTMKVAQLFPTYSVAAGALQETAPLSCEQQFQDESGNGFAALFVPYPEVLFFHDRYRPTTAGSYLLLSAAEATFARRAGGGKAPQLSTILEQHRRSRRAGPAAAERRKQEFSLTVVATEQSGSRERTRIAGRDMYEITALLVVHVVEAVLNGARLPAGAPAPAEIGIWGEIWTRLEAEGLIDAAPGAPLHSTAGPLP